MLLFLDLSQKDIINAQQDKRHINRTKKLWYSHITNPYLVHLQVNGRRPISFGKHTPQSCCCCQRGDIRVHVAIPEISRARLIVCIRRVLVHSSAHTGHIGLSTQRPEEVDCAFPWLGRGLGPKPFLNSKPLNPRTQSLNSKPFKLNPLTIYPKSYTLARPGMHV